MSKSLVLFSNEKSWTEPPQSVRKFLTMLNPKKEVVQILIHFFPRMASSLVCKFPYSLH